MGDGHTGIGSDLIKETQSHNFRLALSCLVETSNRASLVLHVVPRVVAVKGGLSPADFLRMLGFQESPVSCRHLPGQCYYKTTHMLPPSRSVSRQLGVPEFDSFAGSVHEMYELADRLARGCGDHSHFVRWGSQFSTEPKVPDLVDGEPDWVADWRVAEHQEALDTLKDLEEKARHFGIIQYCLWGTGDDLVDSVHYILTDMDLPAQKTEKGETVDLIVERAPMGLQMGIEVTGLNGKIDKRSGKINQALAYLQECDDPCKAVILANTHNDTPLSDRTEKEHFTKPAENLMKGMGIVGLTTMELYRIWKDVTSGDADIDTVIGEICNHKGGVYTFPQ